MEKIAVEATKVDKSSTKQNKQMPTSKSQVRKQEFSVLGRSRIALGLAWAWLGCSEPKFDRLVRVVDLVIVMLVYEPEHLVIQEHAHPKYKRTYDEAPEKTVIALTCWPQPPS